MASRMGRAFSSSAQTSRAPKSAAGGQEIREGLGRRDFRKPRHAALLGGVQRDFFPALLLARAAIFLQTHHGVFRQDRNDFRRAELGRLLNDQVHLLLAGQGLDEDELYGGPLRSERFRIRTVTRPRLTDLNGRLTRSALAVENPDLLPGFCAEHMEKVVGFFVAEAHIGNRPVGWRNEAAHGLSCRGIRSVGVSK